MGEKSSRLRRNKTTTGERKESVDIPEAKKKQDGNKTKKEESVDISDVRNPMGAGSHQEKRLVISQR